MWEQLTTQLEVLNLMTGNTDYTRNSTDYTRNNTDYTRNNNNYKTDIIESDDR